MNLYEGVLAPDATAITLGSQRLPVPAQVLAGCPGLAAYGGRTVVAGIRPEDLAAATGGEAAALTGDVELVEALGSELLVHFRIDATRVHAEDAWPGAAEDPRTEAAGELGAAALSDAVARLDPRTQVRAGERFAFAVDPARMHFFDTSTGKAIRQP